MKLTVFCGARFGRANQYQLVAKQLGTQLAADHIELVYGGSQSGIMGTISSAVLENNGEVLGIYPENLFKSELPRHNATRLITTKTIDERKELLLSEADAFLVFPGGIGTLEEVTQALSWMDIGIIDTKPMGILNMNGYYDSLKTLLETCSTEQFMNPAVVDNCVFSNNYQDLLGQLMTGANQTGLDATGSAD